MLRGIIEKAAFFTLRIPGIGHTSRAEHFVADSIGGHSSHSIRVGSEARNVIQRACFSLSN